MAFSVTFIATGRNFYEWMIPPFLFPVFSFQVSDDEVVPGLISCYDADAALGNESLTCWDIWESREGRVLQKCKTSSSHKCIEGKGHGGSPTWRSAKMGLY